MTVTAIPLDGSVAPAGSAPAAEALKETRFVVPGISCAGCIAKIERGLAGTAAIKSARVRFSGKTLTVTHSAALTVPDLVARLAGLGFDAQPIAAAAAAGGGDRESAELLKRTAVAGFAAMNVMLLSVSIWSGAAEATRSLFHWLSALIAIPAIAYSGRPFFTSALSALRQRRMNMDLPIAVGLLLVTSMSLYETATHGPHAWFDGAVMLLFFLLAGRTLDRMVRRRAEDGVRSLVRQRANGARVRGADGALRWLPADELAPGMAMLVPAGERLAADGCVTDGIGLVDLSLLTGESRPVEARVGDTLPAGALALTGPLTLKITRAGDDDTIGEMSALMEAASQSKSAFVRLADRAAELYAPVVHILAALSFAGWFFAGAGAHQALLIATAVLIITCPCALGLAVPAAQVVACGRLMKAGILVKDGSALERLAGVRSVIFDKTGTLTRGQPVPQGLGALSPLERAALLGLSQASAHPLSAAISAQLQADETTPVIADDVREEPGEGVSGRVAGAAARLGKPRGHGSGTAVIFSLAGWPDRIIRFEDSLHTDAADTVAQLRSAGLNVSILSGDDSAAVERLSGALAVDGIAGARPAEKLAVIRDQQAAGRAVLMVGDGLNDSPALAAADASMAPGAASDVSQQAADIVYLGTGTRQVVEALRTARQTMRIVRQNIGLAILYNALAVPLAMAGFVTPLVAAVAMSLSSLLVVGNALRLGRAK